jgi:hypothetical protein
MKRALAKMLFPNLPRLVQMKRMDMVIVVTVATLVGSVLIVGLMVVRNTQIGK